MPRGSALQAMLLCCLVVPCNTSSEAVLHRPSLTTTNCHTDTRETTTAVPPQWPSLTCLYCAQAFIRQHHRHYHPAGGAQPGSCSLHAPA